MLLSPLSAYWFYVKKLFTEMKGSEMWEMRCWPCMSLLLFFVTLDPAILVVVVFCCRSVHLSLISREICSFKSKPFILFSIQVHVKLVSVQVVTLTLVSFALQLCVV